MNVFFKHEDGAKGPRLRPPWGIGSSGARRPKRLHPDTKRPRPAFAPGAAVPPRGVGAQTSKSARCVLAVSSVPCHSTTRPFLKVKQWTPWSNDSFLPFRFMVTS